MAADLLAQTGSRHWLQIESRLSSGPAAATIEVVLRNNGPTAIAVFNRPHDYTGYGVPDSVGRYLSQVVLRDDGALSLGMIVPPLPGLAQVDVRSVPCVTELPPGAQQRDILNVPLPVAEFNPYFPWSPEIPTELVKSSRVEVWVDYVIVGQPITLERAVYPGCLEARGWDARYSQAVHSSLGWRQRPRPEASGRVPRSTAAIARVSPTVLISFLTAWRGLPIPMVIHHIGESGAT